MNLRYELVPCIACYNVQPCFYVNGFSSMSNEFVGRFDSYNCSNSLTCRWMFVLLFFWLSVRDLLVNDQKIFPCWSASTSHKRVPIYWLTDQQIWIWSDADPLTCKGNSMLWISPFLTCLRGQLHFHFKVLSPSRRKGISVRTYINLLVSDQLIGAPKIMLKRIFWWYIYKMNSFLWSLLNIGRSTWKRKSKKSFVDNLQISAFDVYYYYIFLTIDQGNDTVMIYSSL